MLRSDLCDYSDAYIIVKGRITVLGDNDDKIRNRKLIFKNNAPFRTCISKINNIFIGNAEDLDIVMPLYNLLEYSDNYSITSGSLWNYYSDDINDDVNGNNADNSKISNNKTITSKSLEYKTKIIGKTRDNNNNNNTLDTEIVVSLTYLSKFQGFFDLLLINCETELDLAWSKDCIISEISITPRRPANSYANISVQEVAAIQTTDASLQINNAKLYVPVVTLSINDNIKFLENIK